MRNLRRSVVAMLFLFGLVNTAFAATSSATLHIEGMTCAGCETAVKLVLKKTPGVTSATVSYEEKRAVVTYDPAKTTPQKIATAVADALSYTVTVADSKRATKEQP
jgi:copper chaperone CopZ